MEYGQFCPIAKASEILGEKWTILVVREILLGGSRFSDLQRGLGTISPALLTKRLWNLERRGLIFKKKIQGRKGYEYFPTESCKELMPIILSLGDWGMRWTRNNLTSDDYDPEFLMLYLQRSLVADRLPKLETIIQFTFTDLKEKSDWWLLTIDGRVEVCDLDPGKDVDVYFTTTVKTMADIWTGERTYPEAIKSDDISIVGPLGLVGDITHWLANSPFSHDSG